MWGGERNWGVVALSEICGTSHILGRVVERASVVCTPGVEGNAGICLGARGLRIANSFGVENSCFGVDRLASRRGTRNIVTTSTNGRTRNITLTTAGDNVGDLVYLPTNTPVSGIRTAGHFNTRIYVIRNIFSSTCGGTLRLHSRGNCYFVRPFGSPSIVTNRNAVNLRVVRRLPGTSIIVIPVNNNNLYTNITFTVGRVGPGYHICNIRTRNTPSVLRSISSNGVRALSGIRAVTSNVTIGAPNGLAFRVIGGCISNVMAISSSRVTLTVLALLRRRGLVTRNTNTIPITTILTNGIPSVRNGGIYYLISNNGVSIAVLSHIVRENLGVDNEATRVAVTLSSGPNRLSNISGVVTRANTGIADVGCSDASLSVGVASYCLGVRIRAESFTRVITVGGTLGSTNFRIYSEWSPRTSVRGGRTTQQLFAFSPLPT